MRKAVVTVGVDVVAAIAAAAAAGAGAGAPGADAEALTTGGGDAVAGEVTGAAKPTAETATAAPDEATAGEVTAAAEPSETPEVLLAMVPMEYRITAIPAAGFCRAGRRWFREGEDVNRQDFSDEQWAALAGEPMLTVVAL